MEPAWAAVLTFLLWLVLVFLLFWVVQTSWNNGIRVISNNRVPVIGYSTAAFVCLFFMAFLAVVGLTSGAPVPGTTHRWYRLQTPVE